MKTLNYSKKGNKKPAKENRHFHKKLLSLLLCFLMVFGVIQVDLDVAHAVQTKTVTHTITDTSYKTTKEEGPAYYDYDDGVYYGRLYRTNTTWQIIRDITFRENTVGINNREYFDVPPGAYPGDEYFNSIKYIKEIYRFDATRILENYWMYEPKPSHQFGWVSRCYLRFEYNTYKFTSTYSGMVMARNTEPTLDINLQENRYFHNEEAILLQGYLKDEDVGDKITLKYSIDGTSITNQTLNLTNHPNNTITATGNNDFFEAKIQINDNIPLGNNRLRIYAIDQMSGQSATKIIDFTVRNSLDKINRAIEKYVPIEKESDIRVIVANTNSDISPSSRNNLFVNQINSKLDSRDSKLFFIGRPGTTQSYITANLADDYSISNNTNAIANYILGIKSEASETNIFVVDDYINYTMIFADIEKDYPGITIEEKMKDNEELESLGLARPKDLKAMYSHDPTVFDNPVPKNNRDNGNWNTISSIEDQYIIHQAESSMRGNWTLKLKGSDDTKKADWDKYSDDKVLNFVIHERPKAIIEHWREETENTMYITSENSYDVDFEHSLPHNGVVKYVWKYQLEDGSWHDYLETDSVKRITVPKKISGQQVTNYSLTAYDFHGASDTTLASVTPPLLMEPEAIIVAPEAIYVGEFGSDVLTVNNDTEPKASVKNYQYIFNFKSVSNYIDTAQNTVVNSSNYTFPKNTLRYKGNGDIFTRNATLRVTSIADNITQDIAAIEFVPVVIEDIGIKTTSQNIVTLTTNISNSNPTDHRVIATVKGIDYPMNHIGGQKWEVKNLNITGVDRLYARIQNKNDSSIVYDKDDIVANRPPTVSIEVESGVKYEGDRIKVTVIPSDPDLDTTNLRVLQSFNNGVASTIWSKDNVISGEAQIFYIEDPDSGNYKLTAVATDPHNEEATASVIFTVLPLRIEGVISPNPALSGERVQITADTEGYGKIVRIRMWNGDIVTLTPNYSTDDEYNTWRGSYIVPLKTPDGTYDVIATVHKEERSETDLLKLTIKGNIYQLVKPRIINSN